MRERPWSSSEGCSIRERKETGPGPSDSHLSRPGFCEHEDETNRATVSSKGAKVGSCVRDG